MNKILRVDDNYDLKVSAVIADPPGNSSFQFDFIKPFDYSNDAIKKIYERMGKFVLDGICSAAAWHKSFSSNKENQQELKS